MKLVKQLTKKNLSTTVFKFFCQAKLIQLLLPFYLDNYFDLVVPPLFFHKLVAFK